MPEVELAPYGMLQPLTSDSSILTPELHPRPRLIPLLQFSLTGFGLEKAGRPFEEDPPLSGFGCGNLGIVKFWTWSDPTLHLTGT